MPTLEEQPRESRPDPVSGIELATAYHDYFTAVAINPEEQPDSTILLTVRDAAKLIQRSTSPFAMHAITAAYAYEDFYDKRYSDSGMQMPKLAATQLRTQSGRSILRLPIQACAFADLGDERRDYMVTAAKAFNLDHEYVVNAIRGARDILIRRCPKGETIRGLDRKGIKLVAQAAIGSIATHKFRWW
jgi:hypothetical protein